jgi:hypothetical protein
MLAEHQVCVRRERRFFLPVLIGEDPLGRRQTLSSFPCAASRVGESVQRDLEFLLLLASAGFSC